MVTGSSGYLGSTVMQALQSRGTPHSSLLGRLEHTPLATADSWRALVHCAGRLRGHSPRRIWTDNVIATAALLDAVPSDAVFVFPSSRVVNSTVLDAYGRSKQAAERLVMKHPGPVWVVRLTVLAGPSLRGLGPSFLSRMAESALGNASITVPYECRLVDLLDVREASAVLAAVAELPDDLHRTLHATIGPVCLSVLAGLVSEAAQSITGKRVRLIRASMPAGEVPPMDPGEWQDLRVRCGIPSIPLEVTVRDTVSTHAKLLESHATI